jgi:hypothetical protein
MSSRKHATGSIPLRGVSTVSGDCQGAYLGPCLSHQHSHSPMAYQNLARPRSRFPQAPTWLMVASHLDPGLHSAVGVSAPAKVNVDGDRETRSSP